MKKKRMKAMSTKRVDVAKHLKEISKNKYYEQNGKCFFCGNKTILDCVHIIRRSYSIHLIDNPDNIIMGCRVCHQIFDDNPKEVKNLGNITTILEIMKSLDPYYYERFKSRAEIQD